jgi:hypothetical protein
VAARSGLQFIFCQRKKFGKKINRNLVLPPPNFSWGAFARSRSQKNKVRLRSPSQKQIFKLKNTYEKFYWIYQSFHRKTKLRIRCPIKFDQ